MFRRTVSAIMLALLLASMLTLAFHIQPVKPELSPLTVPDESAATEGTINLVSQEPPPTEWSKTYGGTGGDGASALVQASDGGYALAGETDSFGAGGDDFWLVKTDASGNTQWSRTYGGTNDDRAYSVVRTGDGGYALAGQTYSYGAGDSDFWLVKTDASGNMQWSRTYGGARFDSARSVIQTADGGYALAGGTTSFRPGNWYMDFWLVKTDSSGNMQWSKTYGGEYSDYARSVVQTVDGGYALAGYKDPSSGYYDFWLVKTDASGNMQWSRTYGGTNMDMAYSMVQTVDGGYALAGETWPENMSGNCEAWLVKTDGSGNLQLSEKYGMSGTFDILANSVIQTGDGGYALAGYNFDYIVGESDFWLAKTDANGNMQWNKTYGGTAREYAYSVVQTTDGGCALAGWTNSFGTGNYDFWLVKVGSTLPPQSYSLTITAAVGGTTSPAPGSYEYGAGAVATVRAWQHSGYQFDHWELDTVNVGSTNPYSVTMNTAHSLRAVFEVFSQPPIASFLYLPWPLNPVVGEEMEFDASQSMGATSYMWDFDDGHVVSTSDPRTHHSYITPGTYNIKLTAINSNGQASKSKTVTVKKPVVVLVHGWKPEGCWNYDEWSNMNDCLVGSGFEVYIAKYAPTDRGTSDHIKDYAAKLATEVNFARVAYNVDKVDIVAHSMGGLVSRWYIQILGGDRYVRKLIMLETPNHGIPLYVLTAAYLVMGSRYLGVLNWDSVGDITAGNSQFLQNLNRNNDGISPNVHYEILGGFWYSNTPRAWWDLNSVEVPSQNIFSKIGHGDLIKNLYVISRVIYLLMDDPEPINPKEQDLLFQFAPVISDRISPDEQDSFEILISSTSQADFILTWSEGVLNLTLNTPSGRLIDPYIAEIDPNITYYQDDNIKCYSVQDPESGVWRANVTAVNITAEEQYMLMTLLNTTLTLSLDWQKCEYDLFESMQIRADLAYANESIVGASIDAKILKPDNATETLTLYDDGLHNDNQSNDGIYANTFTNTSLWGAYYMTITANGSLNTEQFAREAFSTVWVEQYPDLSLSESDIYFSKETATEGEIITINATVHNIGEADANNASILFYDGNPANGTLIGEYAMNVIAGVTANATMQWNVTRGTHQINVLVSPYNEFLELNYTNNIVSRAIGVTGHDIGLLTITTSKTVVGQTYGMPIDVIFENQGDFPEDFNVTLHANTTIIGEPTVGNAPNGTWTILTFMWNTTGLAYGNYTISAYAWPVPDETNTDNNNFTGGWVVVAGVGDLTGGTPNAWDFVPDGKVDIVDVATVAKCFGQKVPPAPANCDVSGIIIGLPDGKIDITDVATVAKHYGEHYAYP